jgi:hypothetical protein
VAQKGIVFRTNLTIQECASIFRDAAESARGPKAKFSEFAAKVAGNGEAVGFYTPKFDSPFAAVDGIPDFAVGINILKFAGGAQGNATPVHMYVDDRNSHREVQLVSRHGLTGGGRSARLTSIFFEQFKQRDGQLTVTNGNVF